MLSIVRLRRGGTFASASALGCAIVCLSVYLYICLFICLSLRSPGWRCVCARSGFYVDGVRVCVCVCVWVTDGGGGGGVAGW